MYQTTAEASAWEEILARFLAFLPNILAALVIFVATIYLANLISRMLQRYMEKRRADPGWTVLTVLTIRWGIILMGTVATLRQVDFELTGFLAGLGIMGFTIGFALQDISRNIIAGMLLLVQKPFEIGDSVKIAEFTGRVLSVDMRSTELMTPDGNNVLIPNGNVFTMPIVNYSRVSTRRMELTIGVAYDSDLEVVRHTTLDAIRSIPDVLNSPAPIVAFHTFNAYSIDFTVRFWIDTRVTDSGSALDPAIVAIQQAYVRKNISIPYPIQTEIGAESA
ncbi:MAG: mechanosensitive ion channel [Chloroflexi bacterium]|nr:mechanosensitive ion channel [Chloroflexota bacterium]MDA0246301.1 mechanosensitive ion channel [Chloroflexota bacterium]